MFTNISGVILAGGANKRFNGIIKANIVINGKTILARIMETIGGIFEEIIIVTNTPGEFEEYSNLKIVKDKFLKVGPLGGIHAALNSTSNNIFVFAGDMPLLDNEIIKREIEYFYQNRCDILLPEINQLTEPLHAIYSASIISTLEKYLSGHQNYAVRDFLKTVNTRYLQLEDLPRNVKAFTNINTPVDIPFVEKIILQREIL